jgi:hypothetical protein
VIVDLILIGLAVALDPIPLSAFILILSSRGGLRKAVAFIVVWLLSLVIIVALTLLGTGNQPPKSGSAPSVGVLIVKLLIGLVLVAFAERQRRRLHLPKEPKKVPRWQTRIDSMTPVFAGGVALIVQPWGLLAAGVAVVVEAKVSSWQSAIGIAFFCILSTSTILAMTILSVYRPERAEATLAQVKTWIDTHTAQIVVIVFAALGLWLIGHSSYQLATS